MMDLLISVSFNFSATSSGSLLADLVVDLTLGRARFSSVNMAREYWTNWMSLRLATRCLLASGT